jgi:diguanylate cyclase (GGDEF)-like protein
MRSFRDTPIKRKLITISLISSGVALLLASGGFVAYELTAYREATLNQLTSVAGVIASNSASALSFDDPEAAEHTLSALRRSAWSWRPVSTAPTSGCSPPTTAAVDRSSARRNEPEASEPRDGLDVSLPISGEGDALGTIVIRSRPIDLYERLARYGGILGLVMLFSGLASLPLASKLQRFISEPILQLVETSKRVSTDKDFSARAASDSHDEVGVLVESFNEMLEQIEERDQALSRHRENLEAEVERRTGELRSVNSKLTREISQRQQAEERIRDLAYYDGLTGLPNRQLFQERLRRSLEWAQRQDELVGLLFLDLDRFKQVNDTLGHSAGDELLRKVSDRMHNSVRLGDYVGRPDLRELKGEVSRLGGDEFTVLLTRLSASEDAAKVAQRVLDELAKPLPVGGYELYTTASIGIALYPADGEDLETLLRNADTAMYHAKSRNGNNYQFYTEAMNVTAARKLLLASRLRHALEHGELAVHYQPIRDAVTGAVCAAEALLRCERARDRTGWPRRVHSDRRGLGVDLEHRRVGPAQRVHAGPARGRHRDSRRSGSRSTSRPTSCASPVAEGGGARAGRDRDLGCASRARADRERNPGPRRRDDRRARRAARDGRQSRARRLRHGLFVAVVAAPLSDRTREDRPLVRGDITADPDDAALTHCDPLDGAEPEAARRARRASRRSSRQSSCARAAVTSCRGSCSAAL